MKLLILHLIISTSFLQIHSQESTKPPKKIHYKGLAPDFMKQVYLLRSDSRTVLFSHPSEPTPEAFDARERWPECESIREIANQGNCGSCWAVAVTSMLNDRLCIQSNGTDKRRTSAEDLLTCCDFCLSGNRTSENPCKRGGNPLASVRYLVNTGVVSGAADLYTGCKPLSEETLSGTAPPCAQKCTNSNYSIPYEEDKVFIKGSRFEFNATVEQIQLEILKHGPILASIAISNETDEILQDLKSVYTGPHTKEHMNHAVRIIGWGTEEGVPYWLIANSWGEQWGQNKGLFKVKRGENLLSCEALVMGKTLEKYP